MFCLFYCGRVRIKKHEIYYEVGSRLRGNLIGKFVYSLFLLCGMDLRIFV
jgi:hypothetical protein